MVTLLLFLENNNNKTTRKPNNYPCRKLKNSKNSKTQKKTRETKKNSSKPGHLENPHAALRVVVHVRPPGSLCGCAQLGLERGRGRGCCCSCQRRRRRRRRRTPSDPAAAGVPSLLLRPDVPQRQDRRRVEPLASRRARKAFNVVGAVDDGGGVVGAFTSTSTSTTNTSSSPSVHTHPPVSKLDEPVELAEAPDVDGPQPGHLADPGPEPRHRRQRRVGRPAEAAQRRRGEVAPGDRGRGKRRSERVL